MAKHVNFYTSTLTINPNSADSVARANNAEPGSIIIAKTSDNNVARLYVKDPTGATSNLFEVGANVSAITTKSTTVSGSVEAGSLTVNGNSVLKGNLSVGGTNGTYATITDSAIDLKKDTSASGNVSLATGDTTSARKTVSIGNGGAIATFSSSTTGTASGIRLKKNTYVTENLTVDGTTTTIGSILNIGGSSSTVAKFTFNDGITLKRATTVSNSLDANTLNVGTNGSVATFGTDSGSTAGIQLKQSVELPSSKSLRAGTLGASIVGQFKTVGIGDDSFDTAVFDDTNILLKRDTVISGVASFGTSRILLAQNVDIDENKSLTVNGQLKVSSINATAVDTSISTSSVIASNNLITTTSELNGSSLTVGNAGATRGTIATFDTGGIKLKNSTEVTNAFKVSGYVDALGSTKFHNQYRSDTGTSITNITNIPSGLYFLMVTVSSALGIVRSGCVIACPKESNYGSRSILYIGTIDTVYAKSSYSEGSQATISIEGVPSGYDIKEIVAYPLFRPCNASGIEFNWA